MFVGLYPICIDLSALMFLQHSKLSIDNRIDIRITSVFSPS